MRRPAYDGAATPGPESGSKGADPFDKSFLNFSQTLVWVCRRDPLLVREGDFPCPSSAHEVTLTQVEWHTLRYLERVITWKGERVRTGKAKLRNAVNAVLEALARGQLHSTGVPDGVGDREEIATWRWADLLLSLPQCRAYRAYGGGTVWCDLRVSSAEVLSLWPPEPSVIDDGSACEAGRLTTIHEASKLRLFLREEAECWYQQRVKECQEKGLRPSRGEDEQEGQDRGYSRERVRKLRSKYAPSEWQKAGKPPRH
jgi:hypothetical protein